MEKDEFGDIMTQILSESHPYSMVLIFSLIHKIIHIFTGQVCSSFPLTSFMISCIEVEVVCVQISQLCLTLCNLMDCTLPGSSVHGILQNTGVGSLSLLQGIFPNQGSNPGLLHCRWILYQLRHKGSPQLKEGFIKNCAKLLQLCLILCDFKDNSLLGSSDHEIL